MTFIQFEFLWLFAIVFSAYWLWRNRIWQNVVLVATSTVFSGWVHQ